MADTLGLNNYWQSMPWQFNNYSFSSPWNFNNSWTSPWGSGSTASQTVSLSDTDVPYEVYKARIKEAEAKKIAETQKEELRKKAEEELKKEKEPHIKQFQEQITASEEQIKQVEASKQADGSAIITAKAEKPSFWSKAGRWLCNAGTALKNMGKSFIGWEKDGWNWKKCLKNVAITAAAVGATFIPGVGPVIGAGLLAYGVGSGAVGVAKGIHKLNNAKTDAERDQAQQDIIAGALVGTASAVGLRGIGKGFRTANASASTTSTAVKTSFTGKAVQGVKNTASDMTVNVVKATRQAIKRDMDAIGTNGGGIKGFAKTYKQNAVNAWQALNSRQLKYDNKKTQIEANVDKRIADVDADIMRIRELQNLNGRLTTAEQQKLALLKEERLILGRNKTELNNYFGANTREKSMYDKLATENSCQFVKTRIKNRSTSANPNSIQGKEIPQAELNSFYKRILKEQADYSKSLKELVRAKTDLMRYLAKHPDANITELSAYVPSPNASAKWYKPSTWRKNEYQLSIGGHNYRDYSGFLKTTLASPASAVPLSMAQWQKDYSGPMLISEELTAEETEQMLKQLEQEKKALEEALEGIKNVKTKAEWDALLAQAGASSQTEENAQASDKKADDAEEKAQESEEEATV